MINLVVVILMLLLRNTWPKLFARNVPISMFWLAKLVLGLV